MVDMQSELSVTAVVRAKLTPPRQRDSAIQRPMILQRLEDAVPGTLRVVIAPAGWGKSSLLAQWHDGASTPTVWVSLDNFDNDPTRCWVHLLTGLGEALGLNVTPLISRLRVSALPLVPEIVEPLLALVSDRPVRIVLDDLHMINDAAVLESLAALLASAPVTMSAALGSRSEPPLGLDRRRVAGDLVEVDLAGLRMSADEAAILVATAAGRVIGDVLIAELVRKTEGWPAGLALAGLALRAATNDRAAVAQFSGDGRQVASYFATEVISRLDDDDRDFLLATAMLSELDSKMCDAVRQRTDSGRRLSELAKSLHFLIPTTPNHETYRHHELFRDWLLAEVSRLSPAMLQAGHHRAAVAFAKQGAPIPSMEHALASQHWSLAHEIFTRFALRLIAQGNHATVARWCASFPDDVPVEHLVSVKVTQAWQQIFEGDADAAERVCRQLEDITPLHSTPTEWTAGPGQLAIIRAFSHQLRGDLPAAAAEIELGRVHGVDRLTEIPLRFIAATTAYWQGEPDEGSFLAVATRAEEQNDPYAVLLCYAFVAHIHLDALDAKKATAWVDRIFECASTDGLSTFWWGATGYLARARSALLQGDNESAVNDARVAVELAERRSDTPTSTLAHLVLAEALHAAGDRPAARQHLSTAKDFLEPLADAGVLGDRVRVVERQLRLPGRSNVPRYSDVPIEDLSDREMALLRLLPGDLNQRELGRVLHVSFNTIKTYNRSIYRKLGVASRYDAVARARASGLL